MIESGSHYLRNALVICHNFVIFFLCCRGDIEDKIDSCLFADDGSIIDI